MRLPTEASSEACARAEAPQLCGTAEAERGKVKALPISGAVSNDDGATVEREVLQDAHAVVVVFTDNCSGTGNKLAASGSGAAKRGIKNPAVAHGPTGTCR